MGDIGIVETTFFFKGFKSSIAPTGTLGLQLLEAFGFEERCTHELVAELVQTENNVIVFSFKSQEIRFSSLPSKTVDRVTRWHRSVNIDSSANCDQTSVDFHFVF